jgi:hypothetical protein
MMRPFSILLGARRRALVLLAGGLVTAAALGANPDLASAGNGGGRVYNPKALRVKAESATKGRIMRRPNPQVRDGQPLKRSYAIIPDPRPARRGGSGYVRKGKYFYETPKQITYSQRNWNTRNYKDTVPNPTHFRRTVNSRVR